MLLSKKYSLFQLIAKIILSNRERKKLFDILISICILYIIDISVCGTLYVTYPVLSSNIDGLYGVILPVFFMRVKS